MKRYDYMNCKVGRPAFWLFLFAMLLLARDTMITSMVLGFNRSQFLMLGLICLVGLGFLWVNRKDWKGILTDKRLLLMGVCALVCLLPMLVKRDWQLMYFSILLCLLQSVFLTYFRSLKEVAKIYVCIMTGLALYSLLAQYVLRGLADGGILRVPQLENASGWLFHNFGFAFVVVWKFWIRNFGLFREPGVYQYFILLALYLTHYHVDWKKAWQSWAVTAVLTVTMVSTFAVGGYLETALLAVFLFFDKKYYRTKLGKIAAGAAIAAAVAALGFILYQISLPGFEGTPYYEFYDMFLRLFTDSESASDRFGSIFADLRLFGGSPLVGADIAQVLYAVANNTSSTMILYAILGVLGGSLGVLAWAALFWKKERHFLANLVLMGILFLSFNTENMIADVFFWLFPMMALTERYEEYLARKV